MQEQIKPLPAREMHKYVLGLVGLWVLFGITFATALPRVSQDKKFANAHSHVKSMTLEGKWENVSKKSLDATSVANNSSTSGASSNNIQAVEVAQGSLQRQAIATTVTNNPNIQAGISTENNPQLALVSSPKQDSPSIETANRTTVISEREQIRLLNQKLYNHIAQNWQPGQRLFEQKLVYRVKMSPEGAIAGYEPVNQVASNYLQNTPLSNLSNTLQTDNIAKQSLIDFEVVFTPQGILEVAPWDGWKK
jgi:hypothetical protein